MDVIPYSRHQLSADSAKLCQYKEAALKWIWNTPNNTHIHLGQTQIIKLIFRYLIVKNWLDF